MQTRRVELWVCSSAWCEKGVMRRLCKTALRICGEIKERACVRSFWLAKHLGKQQKLDVAQLNVNLKTRRIYKIVVKSKMSIKSCKVDHTPKLISSRLFSVSGESAIFNGPILILVFLLWIPSVYNEYKSEGNKTAII